MKPLTVAMAAMTAGISVGQYPTHHVNDTGYLPPRLVRRHHAGWTLTMTKPIWEK